jgi:two-component sensor histidine kinase
MEINLFSIPPSYKGLDKEVARIVKFIYVILPVSVLIISISMLSIEELDNALKVLLIIPLIGLSLFLLYKGHLRWSVMFLSLQIIGFVTYRATYGNGIHDTAIVVYPLVVLFSGLVMRKHDLILVTSLVILCMIWLVVGEQQLWYLPRPQLPGQPGNIIGLTAVLTMGVAMSFSIALNMKMSIERTVKEINMRRKMEKDIEKTIEGNTSLLREVHHRVKNNLAFINSIIDLEMTELAGEDKNSFKNLQQRIIAVARVHDLLFQSDNYASVEVKEYLESLALTFASTNHLTDSRMILNIDPLKLRVDQVISLGILLHEIIHLIAISSPSERRKPISVLLTSGRRSFHLTVIYEGPLKLDKNGLELKMAHLMSEKLAGKFEVLEGTEKTVFEGKYRFSLNTPNISVR